MELAKFVFWFPMMFRLSLGSMKGGNQKVSFSIGMLVAAMIEIGIVLKLTYGNQIRFFKTTTIQRWVAISYPYIITLDFLGRLPSKC